MRILIFIIPLFFACSEVSSYEDKPEGLLTDIQMKSVLKEMILVESHLQANLPTIDLVQKSMKLNGKAILEKHKVTELQFEQSMDYYFAHQEELSKIYETIIDELKLEKVRNE